MKIIKLTTLSLLGILVSLVFATEVEPLVFTKASLDGVSENASNGTVIGSLQANHGSEECTNCTFSIVGTNNYIAVTAGGVVTVKNAYLLDYETIQYVNATVRVSDGDSRTADTTIVVPVYDVDEAPVVQDAVFTVNENSAAGTVVGMITASDPDIYNPAFGTLTYSLLNASTQFNINAHTGAITVAADAALDYEKASVYTLRVRVTDGVFSDTAVVTVKVADVNELPEENPDEHQIQETIDCVNYEGSPDARCVYARLEGGAKGLGLYIVAAGEEPVPANALANTDFFVYSPKSESDSVLVSRISDGTEIAHMAKVTSDDAGLVLVAVNALYPISNFEIGTASSVDSNATIVRVYNFYVPGVQYCLDENCNEPITDKTSLRPSVGEDLVIYARAYIPMGPSKGATDTTLQKTFYIKSLAAGENLRYYNVNGIELPSRPFGYQIDFIDGRAVFVVRATGDVASGSAFSMNSYVDFAVPGDTSFLVTEAFPGSILVADAEEPGGDSISTPDTSMVATDTTRNDSTEVDSGEDSGETSEDDPIDDSSNDPEEPSNPDIEFAAPSFRIKMTGPFQFTIVMDEEISSKASKFTVMDLQGRVVRQGVIAAKETAVPLLSKGSYVVKVGLGYRRVNIR